MAQNKSDIRLVIIIKTDMETGVPLYKIPNKKLTIAPASIDPVPIDADTVPALDGKRFIAKEVARGII